MNPSTTGIPPSAYATESLASLVPPTTPAQPLLAHRQIYHPKY